MKPKTLPRAILTDEMNRQFNAYLKAQGIPPAKAAVIRQALAEFLERQGFPVTDVHPPHGGDRSEDTD